MKASDKLYCIIDKIEDSETKKLIEDILKEIRKLESDNLIYKITNEQLSNKKQQLINMLEKDVKIAAKIYQQTLSDEQFRDKSRSGKGFRNSKKIGEMHDVI